MIKSLYPCFQHWSEKGSIYLISDTHFNDKDRIFMGYYIDEREQYNILKKILTKNDTLIHLGHDLQKNKWCKENNLPLIRIPYTHKEIQFDDLCLQTSKFIYKDESYYENK